MVDKKAIKERFKNSIRRGTGEAYLIMKSNPTVDFSSAIIKSSVNNYAYSGQLEGSRALYLSELTSLSKHQNKIRAAILKALAKEQKDTWALVQLFDLAKRYAQQGDKEARDGIYNRFLHQPIDGSDWVGYSDILELDGFSGLLFIAEKYGQWLEKDQENWQDGSIIYEFQEKNPELKVRQQLENASKENRFIKIYLDNIDRTEKEREDTHRQPPIINYITVTEKINSKIRNPLSPLTAKQLSETDIKKLADDFLKETDRLKLEKYMRIFSLIKYPYNYFSILEIVKGKNKKNDRLVEFASDALKYFSGDDIRQLAIERLSDTTRPSDYLGLLISNYKKGHNKLLTTIAKNCKDGDAVHEIVYGYVDIYRANKTKECKEPLEAIYEKLTCGIHRMDIVKILIDNKVLSNEIREEIRYDCDEEIRRLISET